MNIKSLEYAEKCDMIYDVDNDVTMCEDCHGIIHSKFNFGGIIECQKTELME